MMTSGRNTLGSTYKTDPIQQLEEKSYLLVSSQPNQLPSPTVSTNSASTMSQSTSSSSSKETDRGRFFSFVKITQNDAEPIVPVVFPKGFLRDKLDITLSFLLIVSSDAEKAKPSYIALASKLLSTDGFMDAEQNPCLLLNRINPFIMHHVDEPYQEAALMLVQQVAQFFYFQKNKYSCLDLHQPNITSSDVILLNDMRMILYAIYIQVKFVDPHQDTKLFMNELNTQFNRIKEWMEKIAIKKTITTLKQQLQQSDALCDEAIAETELAHKEIEILSQKNLLLEQEKTVLLQATKDLISHHQKSLHESQTTIHQVQTEKKKLHEENAALKQQLIETDALSLKNTELSNKKMAEYKHENELLDTVITDLTKHHTQLKENAEKKLLDAQLEIKELQGNVFSLQETNKTLEQTNQTEHDAFCQKIHFLEKENARLNKQVEKVSFFMQQLYPNLSLDSSLLSFQAEVIKYKKREKKSSTRTNKTTQPGASFIMPIPEEKSWASQNTTISSNSVQPSPDQAKKADPFPRVPITKQILEDLLRELTTFTEYDFGWLGSRYRIDQTYVPKGIKNIYEILLNHTLTPNKKLELIKAEASARTTACCFNFFGKRQASTYRIYDAIADLNDHDYQPIQFKQIKG